MSALSRVLEFLWPPDCKECRQYKYARLGGMGWHLDSCSVWDDLGPRPPAVSPPPPPRQRVDVYVHAAHPTTADPFKHP